MTADDITALVPWERIRAAWDGLPDNYLEKYQRDDGTHAAEVLARIKRLKLDKGPATSILDIGCGLGVFVEACRALGHVCKGLDSDMPCTRAIDQILGGPRVFHRIEARNYLPSDFTGSFGIVTATRVNLFMGVDQETKRREWHAFLAAVQTATGCSLIAVDMNRGEQPQALLRDIPGFSVEWIEEEVMLRPLP